MAHTTRNTRRRLSAREACALAAAVAWLGGCTQFTGADEVTLDGEPITDGGGPGAVPLPANKPISCAYPGAATFGAGMGQTIAPTVSWLGYPAAEDAPRMFGVTEVYDCTSEEVHAILVDTSQFG